MSSVNEEIHSQEPASLLQDPRSPIQKPVSRPPPFDRSTKPSRQLIAKPTTNTVSRRMSDSAIFQNPRNTQSLGPICLASNSSSFHEENHPQGQTPPLQDPCPPLQESASRPPPVDRTTKPSRQLIEKPISNTVNRLFNDSEIFQNPRNTESNLGLPPTDLAQCVTQLNLGSHAQAKEVLETSEKIVVRKQKRIFITALLLLNGFFIFATWWWPKYYYILLPLITITVALNAIMVFSVILFRIKRLVFPEKKVEITTPENIVYVVPCYNETLDELTRSLESLVRQTNVHHHRRAIMVICDGRVRGPGMTKTTAEHLLEDVFVNQKYRRCISGAYTSWTHQPCNVEVQSGTYQGLPYYCIIKQQNEGKRDSLICVRSFLHIFNIRAEQPEAIFSPSFFGEMANFLHADAKMETADVLVGMDADTVFADDCVQELIKESRYPRTVGVCGYVAVDFSRGRWNLWRLYQNTEYTISQGLRRLHQSTVTHKVSCLPGCCQLLRVCEETCGKKILYELFGYCPKRTDSILQHIRATASEDRNHVCLMLSHFPKAETRQALKARAYTDVPQSWSVFLSQRRRWTLGATSNDLFLTTARGVQWFERIIAIGNVTVWFCNIFVLASVASLVAAALKVQWWIILAFSGIVIVPICYYICLVFWLPPTLIQKLQYIAGLCIYLLVGPFINILVLVYSLWNMDEFGWGKTRQVVTESTDDVEPIGTNEKMTGVGREDEESRVGMGRVVSAEQTCQVPA